jgi:hypothetical protein
MTTQNLAKHFTDVILLIPLKKRRELATHINALCSHFNIENSFLINQLSLNASKRHEKTSATAEAKKQYMPRYWIWVEGYTSPKPYTLAEAAKIMQVSETSLKVRVSSNRHYEKEIIAPPSFKSSDHVDGIYVCSKMNQDELDQQLELFNSKAQQGLLPEKGIQSNPSTHQ